MALFGELSEGEDEITREHFVLHMEKVGQIPLPGTKISLYRLGKSLALTLNCRMRSWP